MTRVAAILLQTQLGTELQDFADIHSVTICGKTLAERYFEICRKLGVDEIYLLVESTCPERVPEGVKVVFSISELRRDLVYLVIPLNVFVPHDALSILLNYHLSIEPAVTLLAAPSETARGLLSLEVDTSTGRITGFVRVEEEKPDIVVTGVLAVEGEYVQELLPRAEEKLPELVRKGVSIEKTHWTGAWCRIEQPWDLLNLAKAVLSTEFEPGLYVHPRAKISSRALIETREGPVIIDEDAVIDHDAIVRGPVYIGKRAYVGNNALIRNFTVIESDCVVGSSVDITESVILSRTTIGRGAYISSSVVGPEVVIEPGVVTRSVKPGSARPARGRVVEKQGAIIGASSRIGAYTVLSPGAFIKRGSVVEPLSRL